MNGPLVNAYVIFIMIYHMKGGKVTSVEKVWHGEWRGGGGHMPNFLSKSTKEPVL